MDALAHTQFNEEGYNLAKSLLDADEVKEIRDH